MFSSLFDRAILTILEPSIKLEELSIPDVESNTENSGSPTAEQKPTKLLHVIPLLRINEYELQSDKLQSFELNNSGFYPTCKFVFIDRDNYFTGRHFPKDGDLVNLHIRSQGEEKIFKPIRIDFRIDSTVPISGNTSTSVNKFLVNCSINLNHLFSDINYYKEDTSWECLLDVAENLNIGFASNIENTNDNQIWINPKDSFESFIKDVTRYSYLNDNSFLISYIDVYYYLNFVEVNRIFTQEGDVEASRIWMRNAGDLRGASDGSPSEYNFPNILSNASVFQGTSKYLSRYHPINNTGDITKKHGYKKYAEWWDYDESESVSEFIDPIVSPIPNSIPLGKGNLLNENFKEITKYSYLGIQNENVHENYFYSLVLNHKNNIEIEKWGLKVELDSVNPELLRFSRVYCIILEYHSIQKNVLSSGENEEYNNDANQKEPIFKNTSTKDTENRGEGDVNQYLSGFYTVVGIDYILTGLNSNLRMRLHLRKREAYPIT